MRISAKQIVELYEAIHSEIVDLRIELELYPSKGDYKRQKEDFKIAQVERKIWQKQKKILGIVDKPI